MREEEVSKFRRRTKQMSKDSEQDHGEIKGQCKDLMSTLPREKWYGSSYLYKYRDFWLGPNQLPGLTAWENRYQAQENDVILVTMPKSGTTWLKALMFTLLNRKNYPINRNHPLFNHNPHVLVPFEEFYTIFKTMDVPAEFRSSSSIRLFATHSPLLVLPEPVLDSGCKIVYLCRNLKDAFVSYWHYMKKLGAETSLEELFDMFCEGICLCGPVWDHVLGYWKASMEKPGKVMFLRYDDMKEEPAFQLKRLAEFMGCPISAEEEKQGLVDEILRLCSFDNLRNLEVNKNGRALVVDNHAYFRKGEVGDWKNYLTNEMAERLDQITDQKFHGSGLKL